MKKINKIRESDKIRTDPESFKRVDKFYNNLKAFKDTEMDIKRLELLDINECNTL